MNIGTKKKVFYGMGYTYLIFCTIICFLPFWLIVSGSVSSEDSIAKYGYGIIPKEWSWAAYNAIFRFPDRILSAYGISVFITVAGSIIGLFLMAMAAYVLNRKDFKYRDQFSFMFFFTTLFSGGLIPYYLLIVKYLGLKNSMLSMLLPPMVSAWNILLLRNFLKSVPDSIIESAKIDGAGDFKIFLQLILPLAKPGLATIGLFLALGYWNDWMNAMLFIEEPNKYPLQYLLYKTIQQVEGLKLASSKGASVSLIELPTESIKMATAVVATGPIILLYPFVQKYFVKGLTIGAVKG